MSGNSIDLTIEVDDNGTVKLRQFGDNAVRTTKDVASKSDTLLSKIQSRMGAVASAAGGIIRKLASLKTMAIGALAGWGVKRLASSFIAVGSSMDMMKLSLDTLTKGNGAKWFKDLNEWALKMPVNTATAIQTYSQMTAMGFSATIDQMTTLVDTMAAVGGGKDTLSGIGRALGQMATKGRVMTQELLQLAERGVPVFQILKEKIGLTSDELGNIGTVGLSASQAIPAIIEGLQERFGGLSKTIQGKFAGLKEALISYWKEFQRLVMDSGAMEYIEGKLSAIMAKVEAWYQDGTMAAWAQSVSDSVVSMADSLWNYLTGLWQRLPTLYQQASDSIYWMLEDLSPLYNMLIKIVDVISQIGQGYGKLKSFGQWIYDLDEKVNSIAHNVYNSLSSMAGNTGGYGSSAPGTDSNGGYNINATPQFAKGTGPAGLPYTGLFVGHKGEIIKNPAESNAERRGAGSGNTYNITVAPTFMTGDRTAARSVAAEIQRELKQLNMRWGTT